MLNETPISMQKNQFALTQTTLPASQDERSRAYLNVLFEINARMKFIPSVKLANLPNGIARELCHLQLRHICELVAIGCLVIQADYSAARGEYDPKKVFRALNRYPRFFPSPAILERDEGGYLTNIEFAPNPLAMTRSELESLWVKTGTYLHRLTI